MGAAASLIASSWLGHSHARFDCDPVSAPWNGLAEVLWIDLWLESVAWDGGM